MLRSTIWGGLTGSTSISQCLCGPQRWTGRTYLGRAARWAGRGSPLPGAPGLGLGGLASWAALRSFHFALGPLQRWDRLGLWRGGRWRAHLGPGPRVFSDPSVLRVAFRRWGPAGPHQERPASVGMCTVPCGVRSPEASPGTHAFSFSKS